MPKYYLPTLYSLNQPQVPNTGCSLFPDAHLPLSWQPPSHPSGPATPHAPSLTSTHLSRRKAELALGSDGWKTGFELWLVSQVTLLAPGHLGQPHLVGVATEAQLCPAVFTHLTRAAPLPRRVLLKRSMGFRPCWRKAPFLGARSGEGSSQLRCALSSRAPLEPGGGAYEKRGLLASLLKARFKEPLKLGSV